MNFGVSMIKTDLAADWTPSIGLLIDSSAFGNLLLTVIDAIGDGETSIKLMLGFLFFNLFISTLFDSLSLNSLSLDEQC
jgi:hypothetical protein